MTLESPDTPHAAVHENNAQSIWNTAQIKVEMTVDRLGLGIDAGIKDSVTAFRVYEFDTSQSCEGHEKTEEEHGDMFPWVEICTPEPEHFDDSVGDERKELEHQWTIENLQQRQKMTDLLSLFYAQREAPFDAHLTFDRIGAFGAFRLQSFGATTMPLLSSQEQRKKLILYRKEMADFTNFLKDSFLKTGTTQQ